MVRHPPPWPRRTMEANMNGTGPKAITPITAKATQDGEAAGDSSPVPPETSADALAWLAKRKAAEEKVTREAAPAVPVSKAPAPIKPIRVGNYMASPPPSTWPAEPANQAGGEPPPDALPPVWVPLAAVGAWIARRYGVNDPGIIERFKLFLRGQPSHAVLHYRIGPPLPADVRNLPPGIVPAFHEGQRIAVVSSWDAAGSDFDRGTVDGWPGKDGERRTLPIAVQWAGVEHWMGLELRRLEREAAKVRAPTAIVPPGFVFIDSAVAQIKERLNLSDGLAIERLMKALVAGSVQSWGNDLRIRKKLGTADLSTVTVDLNEFRASGHSGLCLWGKVRHLHAINIDQDDFRCWLDGLAPPPLPAPVEVEKPAAAMSPNPRNPGGRPQKWDWDAFAKEMMRVANTPDGLPDRPSMTSRMKEWCAAQWGDEPADSVIRDKIGRLYPDTP